MLPPNNRKGSGFTNINRVVTANQGNKLGTTVASGVQNQANQVKQETEQATTNFNQEAQKTRLDTAEAAKNRDDTIGRFASPNEKTVQNVTDDDVSNFTKYRTGTYEGPKQLNDYQTLAGKAQNTEMLGDLSRSTGGRQELLKRFVGGSGYNQGQQGLDNLLLGQSGNALNQTRRATQGLTEDVTGANTQASGLAQEYANRAKIFGTETVGKLGAARSPISTQIDQQLKANQTLENNRKGSLSSLQSILSGTGDKYKGLDRVTRLGLGLQAAKDAGYLTDAQANSLLGDGGLIQRSETLGLDTNALLNERIKNIAAQNINRGGAASAVQESQLNALDRLLGKQGTDLEFNQAGADFQKGNVGFDTDSLNDFIGKKEKEKYASDKVKMDELDAYNKRYLNQMMAGAQQGLGGTMQLGGAVLNQTLNPQSYYNPGQVGQNINQGVQGATDMGVGYARTTDNAGNSLIEGLTKLNIGGKSLANTEGGKQLLKALELKNKLSNSGTAMAQGAVNSVGQGWQDLLSGNLDQGVLGVTGATGAQTVLKDLNKNVADEIAKSQVGKVLGSANKTLGKVNSNIANSVSNTVKNIASGGGIKISDENLKTNIDYDRKHIDDFLEKLKPALYDYKDEVKDSPLASDERQLGVMAQDLEKSELGKEAVIDTEGGKVVDYDDLQPKMLASLASLKADIEELKKKK
jgi:hypothetical protein